MSDRIKLLPDVVANQIAAGEVVNRPASVVKEMMENSIDASATAIAVNFRDGGRELIQIVDNGCGMSPLDARMAFDRHATSKISQVEDIYSLSTFGFRGEALASIAAVAQVELRTRQAEEELGTITEINGGEFISQRTVAAPQGSQFMVRNLFYNVPARRKFMDKPNVSANQIKSEFQRVALCNPSLRFDLFNNDAPIYHLEPTTLAGRIVDVVGPSIKHNLLEVDADTSIVKIKGFVGRPEAAKKSKPDQYLFVNGRYFRSPYLMKAVLRAYEKLIPEGLQPACFLYFEIQPDRIDVNVHPQKTEVKFADEEAIWQILNAAIRETLGRTGAVPMMDFNDEGRVDIPVVERGVIYAEPSSRSDWNYNPFLEDEKQSEQSGGADRVSDFSPSLTGGSKRGPTDSEFSSLAMAGWGSDSFHHPEEEFEWVGSEAQQQPLIECAELSFSESISLPGGYSVAICDKGAVVVDLNRAREVVFYDDYLSLLSHGSSLSQQLLFPERLVLSDSEYTLLKENMVDFVALGFDIELGQRCAINVRGVPADMPSEALDTLLYELLSLLQLPYDSVEAKRRKLAASMARSAARKRVERLSKQELETLLERLSECKERSYTPDGRRVMVELTTDELRTKFV